MSDTARDLNPDPLTDARHQHRASAHAPAPHSPAADRTGVGRHRPEQHPRPGPAATGPRPSAHDYLQLQLDEMRHQSDLLAAIRADQVRGLLAPEPGTPIGDIADTTDELSWLADRRRVRRTIETAVGLGVIGGLTAWTVLVVAVVVIAGMSLGGLVGR